MKNYHFKVYKNLPNKPGVYIFKDKSGNVLYVGKAINLKNRVKNYFRENQENVRIANLLKKIAKIDFVKTASEFESLFLEARLIKQYQPKYNVQLKDDKRYLYVGLTNEKYPKVCFVRQPELEKLSVWYGPFPTARAIRDTLRLIRRIFPFRSCKKLPKSTCLFYQLKLCPGMCVQKVPAYRQTIKSLKLLLSGQNEKLMIDLQKKMMQAASKLEYEEAALLKKQIQMMENLWQNYKRLPEGEVVQKKLESLRRLLTAKQGFEPFLIQRLEAYDVANLGQKIVVGAMVVFLEGEPGNKAYRQFKIRGSFEGDPEALKEVLLRRLNHPEWIYPQVILVDGGKGQVSAAFKALKEKNLSGQIGLVGLAKREETIIIPKIQKGKIISWSLINFDAHELGLQLLQQARDEAHRFAQRYYKKLHRRVTFSGLR